MRARTLLDDLHTALVDTDTGEVVITERGREVLTLDAAAATLLFSTLERWHGQLDYSGRGAFSEQEAAEVSG